MRMATLVITWFILAPLTLFLSLAYYAKIAHTKAFSSLVRYSLHEYSSQSPYYLFSSLPKEIEGFTTAVREGDARPVITKKTIEKYNPNSELASYSNFIVETADKLGIDYRWIVAISIVESTGCRHIPYESNNCWGYGIYGDQVIRFPNLQEGILKVAQLLADYHAKGSTTPEEVMRWYAPPSVEKGGPWAKTVRHIFEQMG